MVGFAASGHPISGSARRKDDLGELVGPFGTFRDTTDDLRVGQRMRR